ncbi:MFS transporter [Pseudonocardia sp. GCM10023141]|uniref:MFS transporter n=1 Tax=Pseudonocardia sp. GCM10023141 TaxID=3252653 RepID=UPI003606CF7E
MPRSESSPPRRGRRTWVQADGSQSAEQPPATPPQQPAQQPDPYAPQRRYPWHDDPDYDPAVHRRTPPARTWTPPPAPPPVQPPPARPPAPQPPAYPPTGYQQQPPAAPPRTAQYEQPSYQQPSQEQPGIDEPTVDERPGPKVPRKLTVTRVAAMRSRQITQNGIRAFQRAATADGADRSGLTALTYATMMTYAVDAAVAVALANTLFFAAATAESITNVALYLAITVAPFAVVAPVIGPLLDRMQRGRRAALAISFAGRAVLAVVMAFNYNSWLLYPAALGVLVLSKSFVVLKAAVTPRVLPSAITLITTNSRLTTFGLVAGGVFGAIAAGVSALFGSPGALIYTALLAAAGTWLCLRIPRWVEVTAGEVPAALRTTKRGKRPPMGRGIVVALWGNATIRVLTGFLTLFVAFVVKSHVEANSTQQLALIGVVGAALGIGNFIGNGVGARLQFNRADAVLLGCIGAAVAVAVLAAVVPGIVTAAIVALVASIASALAKVSLDAVIQRDLAEESSASAFGRSETVLQIAWVFGGALGVLLPHQNYWLGFTVVAAVVAVTGIQTAMVSRGRSLLPFLGHRDPGAAAGQPTRTVT